MIAPLRLPGSPVPTLPLGLGTLHMGTRIPEAGSRALLDAFVAAGGRLIDTAAVYTDWIPGEARRVERLLGRWLGDRGTRDAVYLVTKGGHPDLPYTFREAGLRVRPECIRADLEGSLEALGVQRVDFWFLHRDDPTYPVEPLIDALNAERAAGRVGAFGASNWSSARIEMANAYAARAGLEGFTANQMMWSLGSDGAAPFPDASLVRMDPAMKRFHARSGLLAMPYSSLAGGFFSKRRSGEAEFWNDRLKLYDTPANAPRRSWLEGVIAAHGVSVTNACLAYLWAHPFPVVPLVGPSDRAQLDEALEALARPLPRDAVSALMEG
jgi:aryl-alcohol dehydrogenase-like predicted oxidoreductase